MKLNSFKRLNDWRGSFRHLELTIILMVATSYISLKLLEPVIFNFINLNITHWAIATIDVLFCIIVVTFIVHVSFNEIIKTSKELQIKTQHAIEAERRMSHIIHNIDDAIFILDEQGKFTFVNELLSEMTGYESQELIKMSVFDLVSDDYKSFIKKQLENCIDGQHIFITFKSKRDSLFPVDLTMMRINIKGHVSAFQCIARVMENKTNNEGLLNELQDCLEAISNVKKEILSCETEDNLKPILHYLANVSKSDRAYMLLHKSNSTWQLFSNINEQQMLEELIKLNILDNKCTKIKRQQDYKNESSLLISTHIYNLPSNITDYNDKHIVFTLQTNNRIEGIIGFQRRNNGNGFSHIQRNLLSVTSDIIAQFKFNSNLNNTNKNKILTCNYDDIVNIYSRFMTLHDTYTAQHQNRLAIFCCIIAKELGFNKDVIDCIKVGSLLHDIGKLAIPYNILNKAGKLTQSEWNIIRGHPQHGLDLLGNINLPPVVHELIIHHHERLDGSGYPHGLTKDKITPEVRILSVCDVVEAMYSHRPYRPALSIDTIAEELVKGKGIKYDSKVVDCLLEIINDTQFKDNFLYKDEGERTCLPNSLALIYQSPK